MAHPLTAFASSSTSSQLAYVTDGSNGGFSLWTDGFGISVPADGSTYSTHTPAAALSVTVHNISMSTLDTVNSTALNGMDTVVLYSVCDIATHPNALKAVNAFFDGGGKLIILDSAQCVDGQGGTPDMSGFSKPFIVNYALPDPQYGSALPYTSVEASTLTSSLPDCTPAPGCNEPGNTVSDASVLSASVDGWCKAIGGTTTNGVKGPLEAYTHNKSGTGLAIFSGEVMDWEGLTSQHAHARLVFDDMLTQPWNTDGLNCSTPTKALSLTPKTDNPFTGVTESVNATVTDGHGNPVSGVSVHFAVATGPNAGTSGDASTNASGVATFGYTSSKTGTDVVKATFADADSHVSNPGNIAWQLAPPPSVAETHTAVLVPVIGFLLVGGTVLLSAMRRRRRSALQNQ